MKISALSDAGGWYGRREMKKIRSENWTGDEKREYNKQKGKRVREETGESSLHQKKSILKHYLSYFN